MIEPLAQQYQCHRLRITQTANSPAISPGNPRVRGAGPWSPVCGSSAFNNDALLGPNRPFAESEAASISVCSLSTATGQNWRCPTTETHVAGRRSASDLPLSLCADFGGA